MWRVCSVHLDNDHAKKQTDVRRTLADFLLLMLRDHVEIITGDFNQGANVLGEVMSNVVRMYEANIGETVVWEMPIPQEEIRTTFISWPVCNHPALHGPKEHAHMYIKI